MSRGGLLCDNVICGSLLTLRQGPLPPMVKSVSRQPVSEWVNGTSHTHSAINSNSPLHRPAASCARSHAAVYNSISIAAAHQAATYSLYSFIDHSWR